MITYSFINTLTTIIMGNTMKNTVSVEDAKKHGFYLFGNKGAVWSNAAHLSKSGLSTTLCGLPMLSTNWARIEGVTEIGCAKCIAVYNQMINE